MDVPQLSLPHVKENVMCFGCGKDNPKSLKVKNYRDGDKVVTEFTPSEFHQGWPGFAHGGALMTLIDECIGFATFASNIYCVTAKIEVRLKSMARIGEPLIATARIAKRSSRIVEIEAEVKRRDGTLVAEASSVQFIVQSPVEATPKS
jgi:acyl-coenzyme A thioesterase PaaI-like protein